MLVRAMSCLACAAIGVCLPVSAQGEGQPDADAFAVALEYSAAPGCPDVNDFKAIVIGRLGYGEMRIRRNSQVTAWSCAKPTHPSGHAASKRTVGRPTRPVDAGCGLSWEIPDAAGSRPRTIRRAARPSKSWRIPHGNRKARGMNR